MSHERRLLWLVRGLPQTKAALAYAERLHAGQERRVDGKPFIRHPIEVAMLLREAGAPDHLIAAGLLHDVVEKTDATEAELREEFGTQIADLVLAVSEDESVTNYAARKAGLRRRVAAGGEEALLLFAADKVSKVREFRLEFLRPATQRTRRLAHYRRCLDLLEERLPEASLVVLLRAEMETLPGVTSQPALTA